MAAKPKENPLSFEPVPRLIAKYAIPAVISFLVTALYNIVDQIFIGRGVGMLGNAATNVAFPLTTISTALALLLGIGTAANFNLLLGRGEEKEAGRIFGCGVTLMGIFGLALAGGIILFLSPLLHAFGASGAVFPFARTYTGITTLGIPLVVLTTGGSNLVRADGSPTFAMMAMLSGAILNTILDPVFIFVFDMGIAGAAIATVIGQLVSAILVIYYFFHTRTVTLTAESLRPSWSLLKRIASLGATPCLNQLAMAAVQIALNNSLTYYGALSMYGEEIPLACVGVISKVNIVFMAFAIGIAQGCQPIFSFNYGARNFSRVCKTYRTAALTVSCIATAAFFGFQLFPRQIVSIFGQGSEAYFAFSERYLRIYMAITFANGLQPLSSNFFTSIGKAKRGILLSLTRQILFLLPLILIFPLFFGIDGIMYAGPIADGAAAALSISLVFREMRRMQKMDPLKTGG